MKKLLTLFAITFFSVAAQAKDIAGVELPDQLTHQQSTLILNGAGIRKKLFIDIYAAALYLPAPSSNNHMIIQKDGVMALKLHIISGLLNSDKMKKATREGFEKSTKGNTAPIQNTIDALIDTFKEDIKKNDVFDFIYEPGAGMHVVKNGALKTTLKGLAFKQAFFGIWLSDQPIQKSLKKGLLNP